MGLPLWAMENNSFQQGSVHGCQDGCYEAWKDETGGIVMLAAAGFTLYAIPHPLWMVGATLVITGFSWVMATRFARDT